MRNGTRLIHAHCTVASPTADISIMSRLAFYHVYKPVLYMSRTSRPLCSDSHSHSHWEEHLEGNMVMVCSKCWHFPITHPEKLLHETSPQQNDI